MSYLSYTAPQLEARYITEHDYYGLFAIAPIAQGTLLVVWSGTLHSLAALRELPEIRQSRSVQVEDDLYLVPVVDAEPSDFANHSCNPNAGVSGQISLIAMRAIAVGEQIGYDYAMSDASPYDEFVCLCGAPNCRGRVTGHDWQLPELQARYRGYFSAYIQRKIDQQNHAATPE